MLAVDFDKVVQIRRHENSRQKAKTYKSNGTRLNDRSKHKKKITKLCFPYINRKIMAEKQMKQLEESLKKKINK